MEMMTGHQLSHEAEATDDGALFDLLRLQATTCMQKSMTARLTAVIGSVETLLARGYDRSQVLEVLVSVGWHFTIHSFDSALKRVRGRSPCVDSQDSGRAARKTDMTVCIDESGRTKSDQPRTMAEALAQARIIASGPPQSSSQGSALERCSK